MPNPFGLTEDFSDDEAEGTEYHIIDPKLTPEGKKAMEDAIRRLGSNYTPEEVERFARINNTEGPLDSTTKESREKVDDRPSPEIEYWWTKPMPGVNKLNQRVKTRSK